MNNNRFKTEEEAMKALRSLDGYINNVKGDACVGDEIAFMEAVFSGKWR